MKSKFIFFVTLLLLSVSFVQAQYFCFYVDNQSGVSFNELKIRASGSTTFSKDLLPSDLIQLGKHFWVKTGNDDAEEWDVQITKMDGTPLLFTWQDVSGNWHKSKPFITINAKNLHTLVIGSEDGSLTFDVYDHDEFGYGHPCQ